MTNKAPEFYTCEKYRSQLPALQVLRGLGYDYIRSDDALAMRHGRVSNVILETVLLENLRRINTYTVQGVEYPFSDGSLHNAIAKLKSPHSGGFIADARYKHELLCLGTSETQITDGDKKDKSIRYIDWDNIENNQFHMVAEYSVERSKMVKTYRPDIVLFVNGIPFAVIECKAPTIGSGEGISQHIRNQKPDGIRPLYQLSQILISTDGHDVRYATTGTPPKHWAKWQELEINDSDIETLIQQACPADVFGDVGIMPTERNDRSVTNQDRAIVGLLSPKRLLSMTRDNIVFDGDNKKVARYQQHFAIDKIMERVQEFDGTRRKGGVIWHTQGSGKSLTMVMTAMKIASNKDIQSPRIIVVTDRTDLDDQIHKTFLQCGYDKDTVHRSTSGRDLLDVLKDNKATVITTLVHKFQTVVEKGNYINEDPNIFIMVDEAHRTQFGKLHTFMERAFPNASFLGFTGTPISKKAKNTYEKFGLIIDKYTIAEAIKDGAIVPLLYEARHALQEVNTQNLDIWFDRVTKGLTNDQIIDLKRKYSRSNILNTNENTLQMFVWDINEHFKEFIKPYGFKGQIVAPDRESAVKIKQYLDNIGDITSEVIITLGDSRKNDESDIHNGNSDVIYNFSRNMMDTYGDESKYNTEIINSFKTHENPDLIIVVDKLLTGFDVPKNGVLYLCKRLSGHTLLQAIARVNRLYPNKEHGLIVDYTGVLENLNKSLEEYTELQDFDEQDLYNAVLDVKKEVAKLPHYYNTLMGIFKEVKDTKDTEQYIDILRREENRDEFYEAIGRFSKTLDLALSTTGFYGNTDENTIKNYNNAEKKFQRLRIEAKHRFGEIIDFSNYEKDIKHLIDKNVMAHDVVQTVKPVDIMNKEQVKGVLQDDNRTIAAKADTIAFATNRVITEKMEEDPAFYKTFAELLNDLILAYRAKRLHEQEYLDSVMDISNKVSEKRQEDLPDGIHENTFNAIVYGNVKDKLNALESDVLISTVKGMSDIAKEYTTLVDFDKNTDAQKDLKNKLDDYMYEHVESTQNIKINGDTLEEIFGKIVDITSHNKSS